MRGGGDVIFLATRPPPAAPLPRGSGRGRGRGAPRGSRRGDDRSPKGRRRWDARRGARAPGVPPRGERPARHRLCGAVEPPRGVVPVRARRRRRAGHVGGRAECHGGHASRSREPANAPPRVLSTAGPGERRGSRRPPPQRARRAPSGVRGRKLRALRFGRRETSAARVFVGAVATPRGRLPLDARDARAARVRRPGRRARPGGRRARGRPAHVGEHHARHGMAHEARAAGRLAGVPLLRPNRSAAGG